MDKKYDLVSRKTKKTKEKEWTTLEVVALFVIMTVCMSVAIFSCILSIRRISSENAQSDSMSLAHMVNNAIENDPNDIWYQHFLDQNQSYKLEVDTDVTNQWSLAVFVNREIIEI